MDITIDQGLDRRGYAGFMEALDRLRVCPLDCASWVRVLHLANDLGVHEQVLTLAPAAQSYLASCAEPTDRLPLSLLLRAEVAHATLCGRGDIAAAWHILYGGASPAVADMSPQGAAALVRADVAWIRRVCAERMSGGKPPPQPAASQGGISGS